MAVPGQQVDLSVTLARLRPLCLYLLETAAKAQARGVAVLPLLTAEIAEYARAVTATVADLETYTGKK